MIPRLKPFLGLEELAALVTPVQDAVAIFERRFAQTFGARHALAFPYGRSALWAFFNALELKEAEIVQPAYTCSVVAHATVLSGNRPVFVDCSLADYNMHYERLAAAITPATRALIPTHLFGYPMDINQVDAIVRAAETRFGQRIYVIQDCAHSFDAQWQGQPVINAGDGALFGLGISKQITSIFGGMFTCADDDLAQKLHAWRERNFQPSDWMRCLRRALYLLAVYPAFNETLYGLVYWLQEQTPLLNRLTKAYHLDEKIHFPPDHRQALSALEARVGLRQLEKYPAIQARRREIAKKYFENLRVPSNWVMPPLVEGATYSHFVVRVPERERVLKAAARQGVQLGHLIEYSLPHMQAYREYTAGSEYPNSLVASQHTINLPIHPGLSNRQVEKIVSVVNALT